MKKVMILGGARAQLSLIRTAKKMGFKTIVVGIEGNYPGYSLADEYYPVDIFNKEKVLKIANEIKIDGISMVCSDFGLATIGYVCDKMGLSGITEYSAEVSSNKLKMKELFEEAGVRTAKYRIIRNDNDVKEALKVLSFPLIVKAVDLQGSRGIYICRDKQSVIDKYKLSIDESRVDYCIVEEFIEGEEFGAQAFVYKGEVVFVLPHGDKTIKINSTQVPMIHYAPYKEDNPQLNNEIIDLCKKSMRALSLDNCAVNIDLIMKDGVPYIIEVAGRAGANCLPELVGTKFGVNYYKMVLMAAVGEDPRPCFESGVRLSQTVMTKMIPSMKSGLVEEITSCPDDIHLFFKPGDQIRAFTNSRDYIGETLCIGESVEECENILENRESKMVIKLKEN